MDKRIISLIIALSLCFGIAQALEIKSGTSKDLAIFLQTSDNIPIENASCYLDIWLEDETKIFDNIEMAELGKGFYEFSPDQKWTELGSYKSLAKCTVGSENYYSSLEFSVVDKKSLFKKDNNIKNLENNIIPAVEEIEAELDNIYYDQAGLWNKLVGIKDDIRSNYNKLVIIGEKLEDNPEIEEYKNKLIELNNTLNVLFDSFTQELNPKLDQLTGNMGLMKDCAVGLGEGEKAVIENISSITSAVDEINLKIPKIKKYTDSIKSKLNCKKNTNIVCSKLDLIDLNLEKIYNHKIDNKPATVSDYINEIEDKKILGSISEISSILKCNIDITSKECWKLDFIGKYVEKIEKKKSEIAAGTEGVLEKQSVFAGKLNKINRHLYDAEEEISNLCDAAANLKSINDKKFDKINDDLDSISVQAQLALEEDIETEQADLLNKILVLSKTANSLVHSIADYIKAIKIDKPAEISGDDDEGYKNEDDDDKEEDNNEENEDDDKGYSGGGSSGGSDDDPDETPDDNETQIANETIINQTKQGNETPFYNTTNDETINETQPVNQTNITTETIIYDLDIEREISEISKSISSLMNRWDDYEVPYIFDTLLMISEKVNNLSHTDNPQFIDAVSDLESIVNTAKDEIGLNGKSITAYGYLVEIKNELLIIDMVFFNRIKLDENSEVEQLFDDITSNTIMIFNDIVETQTDIDNILTDWDDYDSGDIEDLALDYRERLIELNNWIISFNETEERKHEEIKGLINDLLTFVGVYDESEYERHAEAQSKIDDVFAEMEDTNSLCNLIIAMSGYAEKNSAVYEGLINLYDQNYELIKASNELNLAEQKDKKPLFSLDETISVFYADTNALLLDWKGENASDIIERLSIMEIRLDSLEKQEELSDVESIIQAAIDEMLSNEKSLPAYEYIIELEGELFSVNMTLFSVIEFESNETTSKMIQLVQDLNDNEGKFLNLLSSYENLTSDKVISSLLKNRNQLIMLQNYLIALNETAETTRTVIDKNIFESIFSLLGISKEEGKVVIEKDEDLIEKIDEVIILIDQVKFSSNNIIAVLGYNETDNNIHNNTLAIMDLLAVIIYQTGSLTGTDFVLLEQGSNAIALPKKPSDISIEEVMSNIAGKFERVDYYNPDTKRWEVYVPDAPFGATLHTMDINKVYWIFATEECTLIIS